MSFHFDQLEPQLKKSNSQVKQQQDRSLHVQYYVVDNMYVFK